MLGRFANFPHAGSMVTLTKPSTISNIEIIQQIPYPACMHMCTYAVSMVMRVTRVESDFKQVEHIESKADDRTLDKVAIFVVVKA